MIILAFFLPPLALFAMKKWGAGVFVLILWLLSFPALMFFVIPGVALWGITASIAMYYAVQYRADKQIDKITGAIDRVSERFGPPPEPPREMQRKVHTDPWMKVFQEGNRDTRVDEILGEPQKGRESAPANRVPSVVPRAPAQQNSGMESLVKFIGIMLVVSIFLHELPNITSGASDLIHRAMNYVVEKKETAIVAVIPKPPPPPPPQPQPEVKPAPIPEIYIWNEPVKLLGVAGRVPGIRIISAEEKPTTTQPGGPTMVGTDGQTGLIYACYLAQNECDEAIKKESNLEQFARRFVWPKKEPTTELPRTPDLPVVEKKWNHNGSLLKLEVNGSRRRFLFTQPRPGLLEEGVTEGMVAFDGIQTGNVLNGTAYVFSRRCGSIGYPVSGEEQMDAQLFRLTGARPYVDAQCRTVKWEQGVLEFQQKD